MRARTQDRDAHHGEESGLRLRQNVDIERFSGTSICHDAWINPWARRESDAGHPPSVALALPGGQYGAMLKGWSTRQRRLLMVVVLSAIVVVGDIIALNVSGEVSSDWWIVAVPLGLLLVPVIGIVSLAVLVRERRRS